MLFRSVVALLTLGFASAAHEEMEIPQGKMRASSKAGQRLLSKARQLNGERDVTWVANYDIQYTGCSSLVQVREEGGGGDEGILYTQNLVKFSLCPSGSGCSCKDGGEYVVNMMEFLQGWTEYKQNEKETNCENIREACYCDNANDENVCQNECYADNDASECIEYEGQEEFEVDRYLECGQMEAQNNNNNNYNYNNGNNNNNNNNNGGNNWYGEYFIGPYCNDDGYSINLGVFYDEGCSARASSSAYADRNYGVELPYSSESIVKKECVSCQQVDENAQQNNYYNNGNYNGNNNGNNNNNNNNYNYYQELEVSELCQQVYEQSAKCEQNVDINYRDSTGCEYINKILPRLESATRNVSSGKSRSSSSGGGAATAFAWIFGITTAIFGGYAFFLYRKLSRNKVNLSSSDGALA